MSHHHHHGHRRYEDEQIDSDERMAARMQAEENQRGAGGYPGQGQQYQGQGFQGQQHQGQQYQGQQHHGQQYQGQQYQSNPQSGGYQGQPPQGYVGGPGQQFGGPPPHYGPPSQQYQGGQQQSGGPPQQGGYGRPPQGQPQSQGQGQGGYNYSNQGPQPEFQGNQFQGQTHYQGGPPPTAQHPYTKTPQPLRRKSLLIGINYAGTKNALRGCHQDVGNMMQFLSYKGYSSDPKSQVIMRDDQNTDPRGSFYPNGKNILAAMHWLVSEPNTCNFLHYSGHGGQVRDPDGDRDSGFDSTIVPRDFETNGQIDSDKLHRTLISALPANSTLFVIFDCCHSGSAIELPFVYRSDADGNVSMMDNVKTGMGLLQGATSLIQGGFTMDKLSHAKDLFAGASTFFKQLQRSGEPQEEGVGEEHFVEDWRLEHKFATMFSGCRDDQTSADASIGGANVGAMSWAFLETMKRNPNPTYMNTLQQTRTVLGQSNYKQVPQLSIGFKELDLNQPLRF